MDSGLLEALTSQTRLAAFWAMIDGVLVVGSGTLGHETDLLRHGRYCLFSPNYLLPMSTQRYEIGENFLLANLVRDDRSSSAESKEMGMAAGKQVLDGAKAYAC